MAWVGEIIAVKNAGNVIELTERSCRWPILEQIIVQPAMLYKPSLAREFHHDAPCDSVILMNCIHEPNHY